MLADLLGTPKPVMVRRALMLVAACALALPSLAASGETGSARNLDIGPDHKVRVYKLESVEISGTSRMSSEQLAAELGLEPGTPLNDEIVMTTRTRILGLGLFRSAILIMKKGSRPGLAKLIIEVEDDENVLTNWAIGGELGATITESHASTIHPESAPMDYRLGLIGRNILGNMHRGSLLIDFDSNGDFRAGQVAYGMPRFAAEDVQFDAEIAVADITRRYLDSFGFGGRGQGVWSRSTDKMGEVQYGVAMYVNKKPRYAVPGFPTAVAGPKLALYKETRLHTFYPGAGHLITASLLMAPAKTELSVLELNVAKTVGLWDIVYFTLDAKALSVGIEGYSVRGEGRFDVPVGRGSHNSDQAAFFLRFRAGSDRYEDNKLVGSAAILGVRYHSSGFIAELALKVTRSPESLTARSNLSQSEDSQ